MATYVVLMLGQRYRRWGSFRETLCQCDYPKITGSGATDAILYRHYPMRHIADGDSRLGQCRRHCARVTDGQALCQHWQAGDGNTIQVTHGDMVTFTISHTLPTD